MIELRRDGVTREVLLVGRWAIKLPKLTYGWSHFLHGLLANMQERTFSRAGWPELCPVVAALPGGFLLIMRRAEPLTDDEWAAFDVVAFCDGDVCAIPAEQKQSSFGKLEGRIVAVDYGS